ncbi:hypothetical protein M413DRAFT_112594 [Hebeloma cylindrosporum]|uniref:Uncharacterized protein n=1 Tax=Hebeloma cylindrosporum TaxID=76867 RepID=A0A0C3CLQ3_HEBCY|nr:hypothetical protein M413DRAFT_112594 [Hebeloma cylindrosporum h7]
MCLILGSAKHSMLHFQPLLMPILRGRIKSFRSSLVPHCLDHCEWPWSIRCPRIHGVPVLEAVRLMDTRLEELTL